MTHIDFGYRCASDDDHDDSVSASDTRPMSDALRSALDAVESMSLAGIVAVPAKPTAEMLLAGSRAGGVNVATAWAIYCAMLRAAE